MWLPLRSAALLPRWVSVLALGLGDALCMLDLPPYRFHNQVCLDPNAYVNSLCNVVVWNGLTYNTIKRLSELGLPVWPPHHLSGSLPPTAFSSTATQPNQLVHPSKNQRYPNLALAMAPSWR